MDDADDLYLREISLHACREPMLASFVSGMNRSAFGFSRCCSWRSVVRVSADENNDDTCGDTKEVNGRYLEIIFEWMVFDGVESRVQWRYDWDRV